VNIFSLCSKSPVAHPEAPGRRLAAISIVSVIALLSLAPAAHATITVIDAIPNAASAETDQNSEPSLAVDPLNPNTMVSGTFSNGPSGPFWRSVNGGTTWTSFGSLPSEDKSLAWRQDGAAPLAVTLNVISFPPLVDTISTFQGGASNFGSAINTSGQQAVDQPWIRTGAGGQTYVTSNNFNAANAGGRTASIEVSSNNGAAYSPTIVLETVNPAGGQDAPSVRSAVNGSSVYAAFTRWGAGSAVTGGDIFPNSQVVAVKSTNSGASFSSGVTAATTTGYFSTTNNTPLTLGQERTGSDLAIAVDPNNANRVIVAYGDRTAFGQLVLQVVESTDGGLNWVHKFSSTQLSPDRAGLPGLSILDNGDVGLLYLRYNPTANTLSQHFLTTTDDFGSFSDTLLGTESNASPTAVFDPYLGDFYDLTSVGDTFFGIFSASNADNGTLASYPSVVFQRDFIGAPGTASFQLTNAAGAPVDFSIDPFVFSANLAAVVPEPGTLSMLVTSLLGFAALRRRRL
jgi:hypothetical protein